MSNLKASMFRFTIRDVLLMMVIVGLAVGWWIDHTRTQAARYKAQTRMRNEHVSWLGQVEDYRRLSKAVREERYEIYYDPWFPRLRPAK
jgi:hypothetical protein